MKKTISLATLPPQLFALLFLLTPSITSADYSQEGASFDIDEDASVRALERSLVQSGGLLLSPGKYDVETGILFSHKQNEIPVFINENGNTLIGETKLKRNRTTLPIRLRIGLAYDSQIDFTIPLTNVDQSSILSTGTTNLQEINEQGSGVGDLQVSVAKTLLREKGALPDIIGRFTYNADNGDKTDNGVSLGGAGFNDYTISLTTTKRQDPLVFSASASAQTSSEDNNIQPGNQYSLSLGTFLAASPSTSLRFSLDQNFVEETEVNGQQVTGSDQTVSMLNIGASSVTSPSSFLTFLAGVGLTEDSPDYSVNLLWSTRLGIDETSTAR